MQERFFNYKFLYIFKAFFVFALFFLKKTLSFWRELKRARAKRPSTPGVTIESFSRTVKKISKRFYRFLNTTLQNDRGGRFYRFVSTTLQNDRGGRFYRFLSTTLQNDKVSVIVRSECDTAILRTISSILSITNFIKKKVWTSEVLQRPQMSFLTISLFLLTFLFLLPQITQAATPVYYSVGQNADDHKTGTPTITISGGTATFSTAQTASNMGVGDRVTYGIASTTAYIASKISTTQWNLITATGTVVADLAVATSVGSIIHEYTSLSAAEAGASDANHIGTSSLVYADIQLNFPLYYDSGADTNAVIVDGWETSSTTYIKIYTPNDTATEVNLSQRHSGKWDDGRYSLVDSVGYGGVLTITEEYIFVDGLQTDNNVARGSQPLGIYVDTLDNVNSNIRISNNILKSSGTGSFSSGGDGINVLNGLNVYIWNNIIIETSRGIYLTYSDTAIENYIYNNTIINQENTGIFVNDSGNATTLLYNNIVQGVSDSGNYFLSSMGETLLNNISADNTSPNTEFRNKTVQFVDSVNNDFRLSENDTEARNVGTNLSTSTTYAFTTDIQGTARGYAWDIGADEVPVDFNSLVCENTSAGGDCANMDYSILANWENAVESDLTVDTTRVFSGTLTGTLAENDSLTIINPNFSTTTITAVTVATTTAGQILVDGISNSATPLIVASGTKLYLDDSNYFTVTGTGDALGASPRAVAKIDGTWSVADTTYVNISGWSTDIDNSIKIYTTSLARHDGKWDSSKYRIEYYSVGDYGSVISVSEDYIYINGLQLYGNDNGYTDIVIIASSNISPDNYLEFSNNIFRADITTYSYGAINANDSDINIKIFNNVFYDFSSGGSDSHAIFLLNLSKAYIYNNTIYNSDRGIRRDSGVVVVKNNLIASTTNPFSGTFAAGSDNNSTDINDTPGIGSNNRVNQTFTFTDSANNDFHLAETDTGAKGAGTNLYTDQYINITDDIDSSARPSATSALTWDIGADQTARTIYRSVGPSNTTALADYATEGTLTISSTTATFASALPDNVGVGDVIQYDTDNTGGVDTLAFIHARASSTEYTIRDKYGEYVTVASTTITTWEIYRAYTSLSNAEAGTENTGLDNTLENFETWADGKDLIITNEQWNMATYGDATDTSYTGFGGWETSPQNYIKVYTPFSISEVGVSQRHSGVWDDNKYNIIASNDYGSIISIGEDYMRVEGLQIDNTSDRDNQGRGIRSNRGASTGGGNSDMRILNNIIRSTGINTPALLNIGIQLGSNGSYTVANNIVYDYYIGIESEYSTSDRSVYFVNNTSLNNYNNGIKLNANATPYYIVKNNIAYNNGTDFGVSNIDEESNNLSSDATAPGINSVTNATVKFADELNNDFHLSPIDRTAKNAGTSTLSWGLDPQAGGSNPLLRDIDGHTRNADGEGYDIGADEAANAVFYSVGQVATDHQTSTSTVSITNGLATFSVAQTSSVFGVGDRVTFGVASTTVYVSEKVDTSNWYVVTATGTTPIDVTNELVGSIIHEYTSLSSAEAGASDASHLNTTDLKTNNYQLNFPAYYDNGADTDAVTIDGYTTAQPNYIKIYTPNNTNTEVNLSQRHSGKWDDSKYSLVLSESARLINSLDNYTKIIGLQGDNTYTGDLANRASGFEMNAFNGLISDSILRKTNEHRDLSDYNSAIRIYYSGEILNNIVYGWQDNIVTHPWVSDQEFTIVNNTSYGALDKGFNIYHGWKDNIVVNLKNNISYNSEGADYSYSSGNGIVINDYNNVSSDSSNAGTNSVNNATIKFLDATNNDFRLSPDDTVARDAGVNLSTSTTYAFTTDIQGTPRGASWDIGADEVPVDFVSTICENTSAGGDCTNLDYSTLSSWESAVESDLTTETTRVFGGSIAGTINAGNTLTLYENGTTTEVTATLVATTSDQILLENIQRTSEVFNDLARLQAFHTASGSMWVLNEGVNYWTVTGTGDNLGASPRAVAKIDGAWSVADTRVSVSGWETDIDNKIKIYTTNTARHKGKWKSDAYFINYTCVANYQDSVYIRENYVDIEGLQIEVNSNTYNCAGISTDNLSSSNNEINISHNITKSSYSSGSSGFESYDSDLNVNIFNNIVYKMSGACIDCSTTGTCYAYNNTVYDCNNGIVDTGADTTLYNNISFNMRSGFDYSNNFAGGTNNASSDTTANSYNLSGGYINLTASDHFISTATGTEDFHLKDTSSLIGLGINMTSNQYLNVTKDIDNSARPNADSALTWDIGADQTARDIYRSVGPSNTTALADYATEGTLTISSTTATFASALPDNVGVGDVIQYDTDNSGGVDTLAFIHARASSTEYTIRTVAGEYVTVASTSITTWEIYRAYTSLYNAEEGTENTGFDNTLEDFDTWSGGTDLVTPNYQWNIAGYADAVDTTEVTIDGWTTGSQDYIKIFTPVSSTEVGVSQRHSGKWDDGKYRLAGTSGDNFFEIREDFVRVDGLQINPIRNNYQARGIYVSNYLSSDTDIRISNNIIKATFTGTEQTSTRAGIHMSSPSLNKILIWNNIIYNWKMTGTFPGRGIFFNYGSGIYVYNNTIYNNEYGFYQSNGAVMAKNNIAQNNTDSYYGTFDSSSDNNISDIAGDAPNATFSTAALNVRFADELNNDFHLSPLDRVAKNAGTSTLSWGLDPQAGGSNPLSRDIDGHTRNADGEGYDIGADEAANAVFYSVGQVAIDHKTGSPTITISNGLATFSTAQTGTTTGVGDRVTYGYDSKVAYISEKQDTSNWYLVTATGTTPVDVSVATSVGSIIHEYTSLSSAEAGAVDSNHLNTTDLKANNYQLNFPAYYDNGADTNAVIIDGYTTAQPNYIKIYTPNDVSTEVNLSQRHSGKWDDEKYVLSSSAQFNYFKGVDVDVSNVKIIGIQVVIDVFDYTSVSAVSVGYVENIIFDKGIVRGGVIDGGNVSGISFGEGPSYILNSIFYDFVGSSGQNRGIQTSPVSGVIYSYNNTIYNCDIGYNGGYENWIAKNTIVQSCKDGFVVDTPGTGTSNNLSDIIGNAPGTNPITGTVTFLDATNNDFRLSPDDTVARDAGVDLSLDSGSGSGMTVLTDIMGNTRGNGLAWDIGAHESATPIRRSVGNDSSDLNFSSRTVTVATTTATFSGPVADNIGVGDVIQYGSPQQLAFIESRTSSTSFEVRGNIGDLPTATTTASAGIYRAHLYLADWEDQVIGDVNQSIDAGLQTDVLVNMDLTASNTAMYVSAYASTSADNIGVSINGWITGASKYIKIYTPFSESEVGISQRHSGIWDNTKYLREIIDDYGVDIDDDYVRVNGLQISLNITAGNYKGITVSTVNPLSYTVLKNNIIKGGSLGADYVIGINVTDADATLFASNNIVYGFKGDNKKFGFYSGDSGVVELYNNTFYDNYVGVERIGGTIYAKNNVSFNNVGDFGGTFAILDYNASDDLDGTNAIDISPGAVESDGWTAAFVDYANYDFRVRGISSPLYDSGVTISTITDDIAGNPRPYHDGYDVGAFEFSNAKPEYRINGNVKFKGNVMFR